MRCEIDREVLSEMLASVMNVLPTRSTYPVLQNALVEVASGRLSLAGTDFECFVRREFALTGDFEDGKALLPCRKLVEIVRELGGQTVLLYSKNSHIHVEAGGSRVMFSGVDPAEFPEFPALPDGPPIEFPIATVFELFDAVAFAISKDESRPAMCGVNWEVSKTEMRMVATDGHRLAFVKRKGKYQTSFKAIVEPKALNILPRGEATVAVYSDPSKVGMVCKETRAIVRAIEGPFPDYERVIPKRTHPYKAVVEHEVLGAALRRAAVLAHPVGRLVALTFGKEGLKIQAETPDLGSSEEKLACEYEGEEIRIGFNASYLLDILRHLDSEKVVLELQNPLAAGLVKPFEQKPDTEATFLLMPIRLD